MAHKVLIADDQIASRRMFELVLSREGYDVITVESATKVLDTVQEKRPDLALIDAIMPELDGYQICETLKTTPAFQKVPVILLAGRFEDFDREKGLKAVGTERAILSKPATSKDILAKVQEFLQAAERKEEAAHTDAVPLPAPEASVVEEPPMVQEEYEFDEDSEEADLVVESEILEEGEVFEEDLSEESAPPTMGENVLNKRTERTLLKQDSRPAPQERKITARAEFSDENLDTIADELAQRLAGKLLPVLGQELAKYLMQFPAVKQVITSAGKEIVKELLPDIHDTL
ncbi:hypothetical protein CSB45_03525 [candidate division KSB3 bacterium]|uniref:Response regulatory domain-containing protein n=1 Tax=candidate division KSB3 bacterium TaxID=2044937 RepID=A0A2G6E952_9BACT|nr:MAG: hypothetical protein CSB45_03525 [candidate division KSB3 bacterium]PIE29564.1 MAG: hypothetical protein CSA57_08120 [candidate division KSB3 bacterium]